MLSFKQFKTASFLVMGMVLLNACSSSRKESLQKKQASLYFGAGTQNLMEKHYTGALKNLLEANKLDPGNSEILNNLGMAYYFKGEKDLALKHLNMSLEQDPKNSDAKINLASILFQEGRYNEAEEQYLQVLKNLTYEKQARTYYNLGLIQLEARRNTVAAENYFKKAVKEDESYCPAYFQLGLLKYQRRQYKQALKNFKDSSMGTCYESPAPHFYQALVFIQTRQFVEARLKLNEIETRFSKTEFAAKARAKALEIDELENNKTISEPVASRKVLESPDF